MQSLLDFIETQHQGKHGRARERGGRHEAACESASWEWATSASTTPGSSPHMPGVELVAVADARPSRPQAVAARCGTTALCDYRATARPRRRRHDRRADVLAPRGRRPVPDARHRHPGREADGRLRWPNRSIWSKQARARGAVLQVGHIERFNPALRLSSSCRIRPKYVTAERLSTYTFRSTDIGVVLDLMIHDLDLLLSLVTAPVRSVAAVGVSLFGDHEDVANARIEFEDGSVANLTASRASYTPIAQDADLGCGGIRLARLRRQAGPRWCARPNNSSAAGSTSKAST